MRTPRETAPEPPGPLGLLPEWDLGDLYPGISSPEVRRDLDRARELAAAFAAAWKGRLAALDGAAFAAAVADFEAIEERLDRARGYAQLVRAADVSDPEAARFFQAVHERATEASALVLFFPLEIAALDDADAARLLDGPARRYAPWIAAVRDRRPHQLGEELERLLHEKQVAGAAAWTRLFDETMAAMRFEVAGGPLNMEEALNLLSDPEGEVRRTAAAAIGDELRRHGRLSALVANTLAKDKEIEDRWRALPRPQSARNLSNQVEDDVVDALGDAVRAAFPAISHRYYRMKAAWLGKDVLDYWDRNAPLPEDDDRLVPWEEARDAVLAAYGGFSGEMAAVARRFFDNAWIDAPVRDGKEAGAFSHPTVPSAHPYILLNYQGRPRDVMTLAHELGHGVHQVLSAGQGALLADTPLTLAETASVFGEMLAFRAMLAAEPDPRRRKTMLAGKVEDMINTVIRQIAFHDFELRVHEGRRKGELTGDELCDLWMEVQRESLGDAVRLDDGYRWYWSYVPHFVHSPFYVYAYAFGDCLANALYAAYERAPEGFAAKYLDMLRAGGSLRHRELLAPFGLDASDPAFWQQGLGVIRGLVDELDALA